MCGRRREGHAAAKNEDTRLTSGGSRVAVFFRKLLGRWRPCDDDDDKRDPKSRAEVVVSTRGFRRRRQDFGRPRESSTGRSGGPAGGIRPGMFKKASELYASRVSLYLHRGCVMARESRIATRHVTRMPFFDCREAMGCFFPVVRRWAGTIDSFVMGSRWVGYGVPMGDDGCVLWGEVCGCDEYCMRCEDSGSWELLHS